MINPQQLNREIPSPSELWKKEKSNYRHWIIIFCVGVLVVCGLLLASAVFNTLERTNIINSLIDAAGNSYKGETLSSVLNSIPRTVDTNYIGLPFAMAIVILISLSFFLVSVFQSYKKKSFAKLSNWATMLIGIGAFIAFYQLISLSFNGSFSSGIFATPGGRFLFANDFIIIVVYFFGSRKVSQIRRLFLASENFQKLKKSPEYEKMRALFGLPPAENTPEETQNKTQTKESANANVSKTNDKKNAKVEKKSKEKILLEKMTIAELRKVAKKLLISGYLTMKKQELIDAIIRVTSALKN